jgi:hypothetical protein
MVAILFIYGVLASISVDTPLFNRILDPESPDYIPNLYCGTVARGRVNIGKIRNEIASDPIGFAQGVEEILRQNKDGLAFLNTDERNWLRNETWSLLKDTLFGKAPGRKRPLLKMGFSLLVLKTYDMKTTTLTSFLDAAKNHKLIFDPKIQSKTIEVLENLAKSPDTLCETLRQSTLQLRE